MTAAAAAATTTTTVTGAELAMSARSLSLTLSRPVAEGEHATTQQQKSAGKSRPQMEKKRSFRRTVSSDGRQYFYDVETNAPVWTLPENAVLL